MTTACHSLHLDPMRDLRLPLMLAKYPMVAMAAGATSIHHSFTENGVRYYVNVASEEPKRLATLTDADVLIYVVSYLALQLNRGLDLQRTIPFCTADVLRTLGRSPGGRQAQLLDESIERLHGTTVNSNFAPPGCTAPRFESLISHIERAPRTRRITAVHVGEWLIDQVRRHRFAKTTPASLRLRGLARVVNNWAIAHVQNAPNPKWEISIDRAYFKAGGDRQPKARGGLRKFRHALKRLADQRPLPGFRLTLHTVPGREVFGIERIVQFDDATLTPAGPPYLAPDVSTDLSTPNEFVIHLFDDV
jgi:hypothetical protein